MKKISLIALLILACILLIPSFCFADVIGSYSRTAVYFKMTEPEKGVLVPFSITSESSGISTQNVKWIDPSGKVLERGDYFKTGKYTLSFDAIRSGGDNFAARTMVYINGNTDPDNITKSIKDANTMTILRVYNISAPVANGRLSNVDGRVTPVTLLNIDFTLPEPEYGKTFPTKDQFKIESVSNRVELVNLTWSDDKAFLSNSDTAKEGRYECRVFVKAINGNTINKDTKMFLNGVKVNVTQAGEDWRFSKYFDIKKPAVQYVDKVQFENYEFPEAGQKYDSSSLKLVSSFPGKIEKAQWQMFNKSAEGLNSAYNERAALDVTIKLNDGYEFASDVKAYVGSAESSSRSSDGKTFSFIHDVPYSSAIKILSQSPETVSVAPGKDVSLFVKAIGAKSYQWTTPKGVRGATNISGATSDSYVIKNVDSSYDGKMYNCTIYAEDGSYKKLDHSITLKVESGLSMSDIVIFSGDLKPVIPLIPLDPKEDSGEATKPEDTNQDDLKWLNKFDVEVVAPKAGAKPSTTAKALTEGYTITNVSWSPNDKTFVDGKSYIVKINFEIDSKNYKLRSDYFALVNGKDASMPVNYDPSDFYAEYKFVSDSWSKASDWALEELRSANESDLIPAIFENEDLTKNITRKEFAHVAVKLYEKLSGNTAVASANNPFTDTKDIEVLKAYNVGITAGTSDTTFSPDRLITREQMATMMSRAFEKAGYDSSIDLSKVKKFSDDNEMHDWGREAIYFMAEKGIIKGVSTTENRYGVNGNATREQALLIAVRSYKNL